MTDLASIHRIALVAASLPPTVRWIDAETAGAMMGKSASTFLARIASLPDFPQPWREGHPRWKLTEVSEWIERRRKAA